MTTIAFAKTDRGCYGDIAIDLDLPALTGTEAQIAYGSSVRSRALEEHVRKMVASPAAFAHATPSMVAQVRALLQAVVSAVTTAKDWIDADKSGVAALTFIARKYQIGK